jgi:toxin-antitoxin system PIN domain toxin
MRGYLKSFLFPDLNVWIALTSRRHAHHSSAAGWFSGLEETKLTFCRYTQMGFLRLLTTEAVMGVDVLTQVRAWATYDEWLASDRAVFLEEPSRLEVIYRSLARRSMSSPKEWSDSYLAAFSKASDIPLITFDHGLKSRIGADAILLS